VHPQLNYRYSFRSEAKKYFIKYDFKKNNLFIRFQKGGAEIRRRKYMENGKGEGRNPTTNKNTGKT